MEKPPKCVSKILCWVAVVYNSFFFFKTAVIRKLFDIKDSHTNTLISQAVAYWSRWLGIPSQGLLQEG